MNEQDGARILYTVREDAAGHMQLELTDEGMLRRLQRAAGLAATEGNTLERQAGNFYVAEQEPDGRYRVTLTEEGVRKFETALGLADDFGRHRKISTFSTIADIMDRTATREELSDVSMRDRHDAVQRLLITTLNARYRGSEEPSTEQKTVSHILKAAIVGLIGLWTLQQFGIAVQDVQDIPGVLAHLPSDLLHLDPGHAIGEVGNKINDAGSHVVLGVEGSAGTYIAAKVIRPFERIYRKDQLITGKRPALRGMVWLLRRIDKRHSS